MIEKYKLADTLLANRGYTEEERQHILLEPYKSIQNPYKLKNAESAAKLIKTFCDNHNSEIYVFADYDVDGLTSGFIMGDVLNKLSKGYVSVLFPNRSDGYGLNFYTCQKIVEHKSEDDNILVITVDNGITCVEQVKYLKDNGIQVIVLDHHESKDIVPDCLIVDAHGPDKDPAHYHLCGCSIVFKVCQILMDLYNKYDMLDYTPFVALGTLADMMDLTEENISLIRYGIDYMNSDDIKKWKGLYWLIDYCGLNDRVYPNSLKFDIIPKLNACGRMNNIELAYSLFTAESDSECERITNTIAELNDKRKELTKSAKTLVHDAIYARSDEWFDDHVFYLALQPEYSGICGVIATQAFQEHERLPVSFVIAQNSDVYTGSIRINDIYPFLDSQELLNQELSVGTINFFGGHKCAAGFSMPANENNLNNFVIHINEYIKNKFNEYVSGNSPVSTDNSIYYDTEITYNDFCESFYKSYAFIPFKDEPVFYWKDVYCMSSHTSKSNPLNIEYKFVKDSRIKDIWVWGEKDKNIDKQTVGLLGNIVPDFRNRNRYTMDIQDIVR